MSESTASPDPKLRHEFVGMMFAVAIGEVGIQTASLVRDHNWIHFLPAYSHLFLATMVIATSWVGWTKSSSPGAKEDVATVLGWDFIVLLVDVFLVVIYFILVKSVDVKEGEPLQLVASAKPETFWLMVVFGTYFIWDLVTKGAVYVERKKPLSLKKWFEDYGVRIFPTVGCFIFVVWMKPRFELADPPHVVTADLALVCIVLLFRSLKVVTGPRAGRKWGAMCTVVLFVGLILFTVWTVYSCDLPKSLVDRIQTTPID